MLFCDIPESRESKEIIQLVGNILYELSEQSAL